MGSFQTTIYATCSNGSGTDYYYPAKRSFYTYNEANQLTSMTGPDGETTSYTYDQTGALTEKSSSADITTMTYNGMDRLTQVATPADTVDYGYDALGRRITRSLGADTANKHLDAASDITVYETNASGALTSEILSGADGLISETDYSGGSTATAYYHYNPHGDASALTDADGSVTQSYRYDAFGNELTMSGSTYGYTGKWQRDTDTATGLIRMGVREYDPALGRFVSVDPLKGDMDNPQSRNRYGYALNNPLTVYDLDGRVAIVIPAAPVIIGGGMIAVGVLAGNEEVQSAGEDILDQTWEGMQNTGSNIKNWFVGAPIAPVASLEIDPDFIVELEANRLSAEACLDMSNIDYSWNPDEIINHPGGSTTEIKYGRFPRPNGDVISVRKEKGPNGETKEVWHEVHDRSGKLKHSDSKEVKK